MEVKKNLNQEQRKLLDKMYTEAFDKREKVIMDEREAGLKKVADKCLKEFASLKDVKKMMDASKEFYTLFKKLEKTMDESGVTISGSVYDHELSIRNRYYGYDRKEFPAVQAYQDETTKLKMQLLEKRTEMRAKIIGINATYEEVETDIKELLKSL